ncbi:MAG: PQQ-binding-like beta-propeller repeat protein [Acidimicrobiales bacterium]
MVAPRCSTDAGRGRGLTGRLAVLFTAMALLAAACAADDPLRDTRRLDRRRQRGSRRPGLSVADVRAEPRAHVHRTVRERDRRHHRGRPPRGLVLPHRRRGERVPGGRRRRAFVGDWTGMFYALDAATGTERWRRQLAVNPQQYGGQISASAAFVRGDGADTVVVAPGATVHALDPGDGNERWRHELGADGEFAEILGRPSSSAIWWSSATTRTARPSHRASRRSTWPPANGAGTSIPSSATRTAAAACGGHRPPISNEDSCSRVPPTARLLAEEWTPYTEALVALDLGTGEPRWSFQPHPPNTRDADFAGAPNLFTTTDGRDLVGLGSKDAHYYALDRTTGELVWDRQATADGYIRPNCERFRRPRRSRRRTIGRDRGRGLPVLPRHRCEHRRDPVAAARRRTELLPTERSTTWRS